MYHQRRIRRETARPSAHPRLELWATVIVLVAVVAAILIFLLVYHDIPLRPGGSAV